MNNTQGYAGSCGLHSVSYTSFRMSHDASRCRVLFLLFHALYLAFMLTILLERDANRALDYPSHTHQHTLFYISNVFERCIYVSKNYA